MGFHRDKDLNHLDAHSVGFMKNFSIESFEVKDNKTMLLLIGITVTSGLASLDKSSFSERVSSGEDKVPTAQVCSHLRFSLFAEYIIVGKGDGFKLGGLIGVFGLGCCWVVVL